MADFRPLLKENGEIHDGSKYKGATISGTTTDTMFVLDTFGQQIGPGKQLHSGYYLFPVATIAATLHHTLLEVALSLGLDGAIDGYTVGFYSTLKPKGGFPPELEDAESILQRYESSPHNRHFILWYNGNENEPVGGVLCDMPRDVLLFRNVADGKVLLTNVVNLPTVPSRADVEKYLGLVAPKFAAEFKKLTPLPPAQKVELKIHYKKAA